MDNHRKHMDLNSFRALLLTTLITLPFFSTKGHAELVRMSFTVKANNDCNHYFDDPGQKGRGFEQCNIFAYDDLGTYVKISPVIAKFDVGGQYTESDLYGSQVSANNWSFSSSKGDSDEPAHTSNGSWQYDNSQGAPGIRFWSAKAGRAFNLFWMVDDNQLTLGGACAPPNLPMSLGCLNAAHTISQGDYHTPKGKKLSHIVFYNSKETSLCPGGDCSVDIVEDVNSPWGLVFPLMLVLFMFEQRQKRVSPPNSL